MAASASLVRQLWFLGTQVARLHWRGQTADHNQRRRQRVRSCVAETACQSVSCLLFLEASTLCKARTTAAPLDTCILC